MKKEAMLTSVSIVIPAYNEEQGIGPVLQELARVMAGSGLCYEILVVDDGSTDGTAVVAREFVAAAGQLTVLQHRRNRGYGAALKTGIRHAAHDVVCITDADGTYPNEEIPGLVQRLVAEAYDMVVGARTGNNVAIPKARRPAKWAINRLANYVAGEPIPDPNSGLRVFRAAVARRMLPILPDKFSFTTTLTLALLTNGYLVDFVPVDYFKRTGRSKIRPVQDTLNFVGLVWRMALYFAPLKFFLPLSGLLFVVAMAWAFYSLLVLGQLADVTTLIIAMTAFQVAVIGLLAEVINKRLPNVFRE